MRYPLIAVLLLHLPCRAVAQPQVPALPLPLSPGGSCSFVVPCARSDDLSGHIHGAMLILDVPDNTRPALHLAFSVSLFRWAELGVSWLGSFTNDTAAHHLDVHQGPLTLWGRLSFPYGLLSKDRAQGLFLAAQVQLDSTPPPLDQDGRLLQDTTTYTLVSEYRRWRVHAAASLGLQIAQDARYLGLQAGAGLWATLYKGQGGRGLMLGGEVLGRAGALSGEASRRTSYLAVLGVGMQDDFGVGGGIVYLHGDGRELPANSFLAGLSYSIGPRFKRPPPEPGFPPLFPDMNEWWARRQARRALLAQKGLLPQEADDPSACQPSGLVSVTEIPALAAACARDWAQRQGLLGPLSQVQAQARPPIRPLLPRPGVRRPLRGPSPYAPGEPPPLEWMREPPGPPRLSADPERPPPRRAEAEPAEAEPTPARPAEAGTNWNDLTPQERKEIQRQSDGPNECREPPGFNFHDKPQWSPEAKARAERAAGEPASPGHYGHLPGPARAEPGKEFSPAQLRRAREENMRRNGGVLKDDSDGKVLVVPEQHRPGVTPPANEAHGDHIIPRSAGGTNANANLQILSRENNLKKGAKR